MHFGALERILEQFFDDIKKVKFWWFFEIFAIFAKILPKLKCSKNARKMQKKYFLCKKNAKKNYFDTMNMILGLVTKIENLDSNIAKIMDFDEKMHFFCIFQKMLKL